MEYQGDDDSFGPGPQPKNFDIIDLLTEEPKSLSCRV